MPMCPARDGVASAAWYLHIARIGAEIRPRHSCKRFRAPSRVEDNADASTSPQVSSLLGDVTRLSSEFGTGFSSMVFPSATEYSLSDRILLTVLKNVARSTLSHMARLPRT